MNTNKKLNTFAYALAIAGLVAELAALIPFPRSMADVVRTVGTLLSTLPLMFFRLQILFYNNHDTGLQTNYLALTAYSLLLIGAIAWTVSKGRETRLVRAILALIVLEQALFLVSNIVSLIVSFKQYMAAPIWFVVLAAAMIEHVVLSWFLFKALREYQYSRKLQNEEHEAPVTAGFTPVYTPLFKRFTNLVIDTFLCVFTLMPVAVAFQFIFGPVERKFGEQIALYVLLIIGRLIYYPFFETLFGATPAKLFTESRVVTDEGNETPSFGIATYRTVCRFIPFEPFSFLFSVSGWHDNFTNTRVVNEERTGVRLRIYGLIIPAIIFVVSITYYAHEKYEEHKSYVYYKERHEQKISTIKRYLASIDTTTVIKLEDVDHPYASEEIYLKIAEINGDKLTAYVIELKENYSKSITKVEKLYNRGKVSGFLSVVVINRSDLDKAYTIDYDQSETYNRNSARLLGDNRKFEIEYIDKMFRPSIHDRGTGSQGGESGSINIDLLNHGWPARVVSLETLEGTIKWPDEVDIEAPTVRQWDSPDFSVYGDGYVNGEHYKFKMTVRDSLGRDYTYIVDGRDMNKTVELVE